MEGVQAAFNESSQFGQWRRVQSCCLQLLADIHNGSRESHCPTRNETFHNNLQTSKRKHFALHELTYIMNDFAANIDEERVS